ncbi:DMT family transporter [Falsiroseomonas sp. HW251]|uniref:DMT family transporter n=1 Tax=Falsiroseomonas sp. HW251 TaxID=3390998 RepID=UPI003D31921F
MTRKLWGLLLLLSVIWGASFFFAAVSLTGFRPFTIVLGRVAIAAVALVVACPIAGLPLPRSRAQWMAVAGMGMFNNALPFTLIVTGQTFIPSSLAGVLNAATPVFAVLCLHVATADDRLRANTLAGALTGLAGVAVLAGPAAFAGGRPGELLGILLCLGACLSYGISAVWARRLRSAALPPLSVAAGQCISSTLMMLPLVLVFDQPWAMPAPPAQAVAALVAFGLVSTGVAYALFYAIMARAGATNAMLVTLLVPVTALILGTLALGEQLLPRHVAGMAVIGIGLLLIDGRIARWIRAR